LHGFGKLLRTVDIVAQRLNPGLRLTGVVLCMYESGTRLAAEVTSDVQQFLEQQRSPSAVWSGAKSFRTRIRRNIRLAEAPSFGQTIFQYAPESNGAKDYRQLACEVLGLPLDERSTTSGLTPPMSAVETVEASLL
jgi:chromosome partitioning protein